MDSSIYVFKYWYVLPDSLVDQEGNQVNAVLGFLDFVLQLIKRENPSQIVFAFDESLETSYRKQIYPLYKANREPAPDNLKYQFLLCRQFLSAIGISEYGSGYYEADDIIGSLAALGRASGKHIAVVSGDKDLTQLVGDNDIWWEYANNRRLDPPAIKKHFEVWPHQIADMLALAGDKVDNIPGVPGIGQVTAAKLLNKFGSIENLINNAADIGSMKMRGAKRVQILIESYTDEIHLARRLTSIVHDIDPAGLPSMSAQLPARSLSELFDLLNFRPGLRQQWQQLVVPQGYQ